MRTISSELELATQRRRIAEQRALFKKFQPEMDAMVLALSQKVEQDLVASWQMYDWLEWAEREGGEWYHSGALDIGEEWQAFVWRYLQQAAETIDRDIMEEEHGQ